MKDNYRILITKFREKIISILYLNNEALEIGVEEDIFQGSIHIAKIKNIVKNINAAFIEIQKNKSEKELCYYSLEENKYHNFVNESARLCEQEDIIVQISKESVKTKQMVASSHINIAGTYVIVSRGRGNIRFSSKIKDKNKKELLKEQLSDVTLENLDILVRTKAFDIDDISIIKNEVKLLSSEYNELINNSRYRTSPMVLKESEPKYLQFIKKISNVDELEVITDINKAFEDIDIYFKKMKEIDLNFNFKLRLYDDERITLSSLYSIKTLMENVLSKKVWLKSGAYLVIDYTEAMTIIDVNTGKNEAKTELGDTIKRVNLEAVSEIASLLRLRNISGIIIIDFIDMKDDRDKKEIFDLLNLLLSKDSVKARAVDFTTLGLVEMTRQKLMKPIYEYF